MRDRLSLPQTASRYLAGLGGTMLGMLMMPIAQADSLPAPIQALADQGLQIHGEFDAPGGMR
eukprot:36144-Eustigmatos_ZCMA.PRE.1